MDGYVNGGYRDVWVMGRCMNVWIRWVNWCVGTWVHIWMVGRGMGGWWLDKVYMWMVMNRCVGDR